MLKNKLIKIIKYLLISFVSFFTLAIIVLSILYSPTYVYRYIFLNVGDVYDYKTFEHRVIKKSDSPFYFKKALENDFVESLFIDKINNSGCTDFNDYIKKSKITSLIIIQNDTILYEKYFNGFQRDSLFHSMSVAKTFISAMIGFALEDGFIKKISDPITEYIPELIERDKNFRKITIKNLLMMRSGIQYNEVYYPGTYMHLPWHDEALGYYHPDVRKLLLEYISIKREPGKLYQYNNYNTYLLGLILERSTKQTVSRYLETKLWKQIGMEYNAIFTLDSKKAGFERMPSALIVRAIDYAKLGRLYLNNGKYMGKLILPVKWIKDSISEDKTIPRKYYPVYMGSECDRVFYKYQWWGHRNCDSTFNFFMSGNLGQAVYIAPHHNLIIVQTGNSNKLFNKEDLWHVERLITFKDFHNSIINLGVKDTIKNYIKKKDNPNYIPPDERMINTKGYGYLNKGKIEDAKYLFIFNTKNFPDSSNAYDSLAEAYMKNGEKKLAVKNYRISLRLNSNNKNAVKMIKKLIED